MCNNKKHNNSNKCKRRMHGRSPKLPWSINQAFGRVIVDLALTFLDDADRVDHLRNARVNCFMGKSKRFVAPVA